MKSTNSKVAYIQATEDYYSQMSDAKFVKEFERIHEKDISENYTVIQAKFLPFFEANLNKDAYWELYDEWKAECAYLEVYLEQYPELISQLPISELWALDPWERLMLLIRCTENAAIIKQTLEGNDIWATTLPSTRRASFNVFFSILIFTSMSLLELQNSSAPPIKRPMRLIITEVIYR